MSNKRIDLTQFKESFQSLLNTVLVITCTLKDGEGLLHDRIEILCAELKRCYVEIDRLNHAAHTCDDCGGHRESINDCENVCQCLASE